MSVGQRRTRPRNQRASNHRQRRQQHLLDVKVRSRSATQHRNRRIVVWLSKIMLVFAIGIGLYFGVREGARRFFFENPDYEIKIINVQTDGTLQRDQILHVAGLREGENVFRVNLAQVRDRLQDLPQVDEVQLVRKLPSEVDIKILERKPIAWISKEKEISDPFVSDAAFLVDARGVLMKEKKLLPEYLGLPLISGCSSESLEPGNTIESVEANAALELLKLSTGSFMQTRFQIRQIDISKGYCLQVTDKNRARVSFGFEQLDQQLKRLEQFLVYCDDTKQELATVNLLVQRNIPVTFGQPASEIINDTIDPQEQPMVMKAVTVRPQPKADNASSQKAAGTSGQKGGGTAPLKPFNSSSSQIKRAIPTEKGKKKDNGQ
jgi:cell division protein FtsQ